jgi:hypothetical protein
MDCGFNGYEEIAAILAERGYNVGESSVYTVMDKT